MLGNPFWWTRAYRHLVRTKSRYQTTQRALMPTPRRHAGAPVQALSRRTVVRAV